MNPISLRGRMNSLHHIVSTDDQLEGLPGSPDVIDFYRPQRRKPLPAKLMNRYPAKLTTFFATFVVVFVTLMDWLQGQLTFAASQVRVFEQGNYALIPLSMLSHSDLGHLLANLVFFVGFGYLLKSHFGLVAFPILPALIGIATTILTVLANPPHVGLIGASGIVFSLVGTWVTLYFIFEKRHTWGARLIRVTGFLLVLFFPSEYSATTSYLAHGIGFSLGMIGALILAPHIQSSRQKIAAQSEIAEWNVTDATSDEDTRRPRNSPRVIWIQLSPTRDLGFIPSKPNNNCAAHCS